MKRNLLITSIVILTLTSVLMFNNKKSFEHGFTKINADLLKTENNSSDGNENATVHEQSASHFASVPKVYKATNRESGTIGILDGSLADNPADNVFHVMIDQEIYEGQQAYLEYELYGVEDYSSVCRGINNDVSTGGIFVKIYNAWSHQSEQIQVTRLQKGDNTVRFSVPSNCEFGYKVKNLRIRFEENDNNERKLVVNQPSLRYYFKKYGYISGYVSGPGSEKAKLYANGKLIRSYKSLFEGSIEKTNDSLESWQAEITAVFDDGQQISLPVMFDKPCSWDYMGDYSSSVPYFEKEIMANLDFDVTLTGCKLKGEAGAITNNQKLSITGLRAEDMALMGSDMVNITGINKGYRCLPHGSTFDKNIEIRIKYDTASLPIGYSPKDIRTYYYDEKSADWVMLPYDTLDLANMEVVSYTNHFTDFINGILKTPESPTTQAFTPTSMKDIKFADPLAGYNIMQPPSANNSGTANMSLPLEIPNGRQGMQPQLAISYNSEGGNGWLGVGWDLNIPCITVDTRWGVPHYFANLESESYLLNGEELLPMVQRREFVVRDNNAMEKIFTPRIEGEFQKIIRHGNSPSTYWWEVIDKQGVKYYYGAYHDEVLSTSCILADPNFDHNIAKWMLAEVIDLNGNTIKYNYQTEVYAPGNPLPGNGGIQIYPESIEYTGNDNDPGHYKVEFFLKNGRNDLNISARNGFLEVTDQLLSHIDVSYDNTRLRSYFLIYNETPNSFNKNRLCYITDITSNQTYNGFIDPNTIPNCSSDLSDFPGCKVHKFQYFDVNSISPDFSDPENIYAGNDIGNIDILEGMFNVTNIPALGKSVTTGWSLGGSLNLGLGANAFLKTISVGGSYTYNASKTKDHLMFSDINGDGFPDRVFKEDDGIYYKELQCNVNSQASFGSKKKIEGLPGLVKSSNRANTWGIEGQILVLAGSCSWTKTKNYTSAYFADVNADGYPDYIDDGTVYYNNLWDTQNPVFIEESPSVYQTFLGNPCDTIFRSGEINDSVYTEIPSEDYIYDYNRDAVRMWVAPYTGTINIKSKFQLIESDSYSWEQSRLKDGVIYFIQQNNQKLKQRNIHYADFSVHTFDSTISINQGDKLYFRLNSKNNRDWDDVIWSPNIIYNQINGNSLDTNVVDAEGMKIAVFKPSKDLLIYNQQIFTAPINGNIRIKGSIIVDSVSDEIDFMVEHNSNILEQDYFNMNTSYNHYIDHLVSVSAGDIINIKATTTTNIDWHKITNDFKIYYYQSDSAAVDTTVATSKIEVKPIVQFNMYQRDLKPSYPLTVSQGTYNIEPVISGSSNATGTMVLAIKKGNVVVLERDITLQNGVLNPSNQNFTVTFAGGGNAYFDYYWSNQDGSFTTSDVKVNTVQRMAGLHTHIADDKWIFGNLYRGWGQFSYHDNSDTTFIQNIDEYELHLSSLADPNAPQNPNPIENMTLMPSATNNVFDSTVFDGNSGLLSMGGENDPLNEPFNIMFPDLDSMTFHDYAKKSHVGKLVVSNSILKPKSTSTTEEVFYDSPLITQTNSNIPVRSVRKSNVEKNFAYSVSLSIGIKLSYAHNKTEGETDMDYMDLNGDRYPDIVGIENVQFTKPSGGFLEFIDKSILDRSIGSSTCIGSGTSFGVNLPRSTASAVKSNDNGGDIILKFTDGQVTGAKITPPSATTYNTTIEQSEFSLGASDYITGSRTNFALQDINGDGLPDKVDTEDGMVELNHGYQFGADENWGLNEISFNNGLSVGGSISLSFNTSQYSWSGGINIGTSESKQQCGLIDMNNDGCADLVNFDPSSSTLKVYFNSGHGFQQVTNWVNQDLINESNSTNGSVYLAGSGGFTFLGIVKIVINLQGSISGSVNYDKLMIVDVNNDGYPDIVTMDQNNMQVRYSNLKLYNVLKQVETPSKSSYKIDYTLSQCNQQMPQRQWVMTSLKVYDGFKGDGQDTLYQKFAYSDGYYNRYERTSLGFGQVVSALYDNFTSSGTCYRSTIEKYHNRDYLFKGLKYYELSRYGLSAKYIETYYKYDRKEIETGEIVQPGYEECYGPYYPAISQEDRFYYEGQSNYQIHTQKKYAHGEYGNIIKYTNRGDVNDPADDLFAEVTYSYDVTQNLLAMVDEIIVKDTNNNLLRQKKGSYDNKGQITQIMASDGGNYSVTDLEYNNFGNISKITLPENASQQRAFYEYEYEQTLNIYPERVRDVFGNESFTYYDIGLGLLTQSIDISGNQMEYTYYPDGKPMTVRGPKEIESGAPYTIKFEYSDESNVRDTLWALTLHLDPQDPMFLSNFTSLTVADGIGRIVQTRKNVVVSGVDKDLVSGRQIYDAYGRVVSSTLPKIIAYAYPCLYYTQFGTNHSSTTYETFDRPLIQVAPDLTTTQYQYDFAQDDFGITRFFTTIVDPNGGFVLNFTNPRGQNTMVSNPLAAKTKFAYNPMGELLQSIDPEDNSTYYGYDLLGRMVERIHPDAGTTTYTYDGASNLMTTQTANLAANTLNINYDYDFNRLIKVTYPENPENNVYYEYGDAGIGNKAGKIVKMQDASGVQTFDYGNMGEMTQNIHTFVVPEGESYTFEMDWQYDSWNRTKQITYPDGEVVSYIYDGAGQLYNMSGVKGSNSYKYIETIEYNMYGSRERIVYGNGSYAQYQYNSLNQSLINLKSYDASNTLLQDIDYYYDDVKNITDIVNTSDSPDIDLDGYYNYHYSYDELYRLKEATGSYDKDNESYAFNLKMDYSNSGNILYKEQAANTMINGQPINMNYSNYYDYQDRPHTVTQAGLNTYSWDANGNMIERVHTTSGFSRNLCWDEENRLTTVRDFGAEPPLNLSSYIYNASGDRTWKLTGPEQTMWINGETTVQMVDYAKTLYANPYMVVSDQQYSKHYYIEGERICTKLGSGFSVAPILPATDPLDPIEGTIVDISKFLREMINRGLECSGSNAMVYISPAFETLYDESNEAETSQYFYQSDHLGSSSFITNINGAAIQHLQYLPFGETFMDERTNDPFNTPYKFSGKEKDDETQYSYFGARYYDSDLSVWLSVDPLSDKYPSLSPFMYCAGNPVMLVDPDGRWIEVSTFRFYKNRNGEIKEKKWYNFFNRTVCVKKDVIIHNAKFYDAEQGTKDQVNGQDFAKSIENNLLKSYNSSDENYHGKKFEVSLKFENDNGSSGIQVVNSLNDVKSEGPKPDNLFVHVNYNTLSDLGYSAEGVASLDMPIMCVVTPDIVTHELMHNFGNFLHEQFGATLHNNPAQVKDIKNILQPTNTGYKNDVEFLKLKEKENK